MRVDIASVGVSVALARAGFRGEVPARCLLPLAQRAADIGVSATVLEVLDDPGLLLIPTSWAWALRYALEAEARTAN